MLAISPGYTFLLHRMVMWRKSCHNQQFSSPSTLAIFSLAVVSVWSKFTSRLWNWCACLILDIFMMKLLHVLEFFMFTDNCDSSGGLKQSVKPYHLPRATQNLLLPHSRASPETMLSPSGFILKQVYFKRNSWISCVNLKEVHKRCRHEAI